MSRLLTTLFKHNLCRKKTVIIGSANHMAKAMSVLDQEQLLKCFIWQRSVMKTVYLSISKKRRPAVTHWLCEAVSAQTSYLTKTSDEGVWSSQQNWRVARLELKIAELHYAAQRVSSQWGYLFNISKSFLLSSRNCSNSRSHIFVVSDATCNDSASAESVNAK